MRRRLQENTFGICCDWDDGRVWCISLHDDLHQLYSDFNVWDCSHKNMIVFCLLERFNTMHWQGYTDFLLSSIVEVRMLAVCTLESNFWTPDECTSCIHPPFRIVLVSTNSWKWHQALLSSFTVAYVQQLLNVSVVAGWVPDCFFQAIFFFTDIPGAKTLRDRNKSYVILRGTRVGW